MEEKEYFKKSNNALDLMIDGVLEEEKSGFDSLAAKTKKEADAFLKELKRNLDALYKQYTSAKDKGALMRVISARSSLRELAKSTAPKESAEAKAFVKSFVKTHPKGDTPEAAAFIKSFVK